MTKFDALRPCRAPLDVGGNVRTYLAGRKASERYASFDYCFNHFQSFRVGNRAADLAGSPAALQYSCLQLGFYLASWGMLRGSTDLLQRSVKVFQPLIEAISVAPAAIWLTDANSYSSDTWLVLREFAHTVRTCLPGASDILVTKIMLGVFGCVPAFDTYFRQGSGLSTFGESALLRVRHFYDENSDTIEAFRVPTLDFATGRDTSLRYTRAKVIDMIFFIEGGRSR